MISSCWSYKYAIYTTLNAFNYTFSLFWFECIIWYFLKYTAKPNMNLNILMQCKRVDVLSIYFHMIYLRYLSFIILKKDGQLLTNVIVNYVTKMLSAGHYVGEVRVILNYHVTRAYHNNVFILWHTTSTNSIKYKKYIHLVKYDIILYVCYSSL